MHTNIGCVLKQRPRKLSRPTRARLPNAHLQLPFLLLPLPLFSIHSAALICPFFHLPPQSLTSTEDDTVFVDCPQLRSLNGLNSLTRLGRDLVLRNLPSLTSTAGLANLTTVGESLCLY